MSLRFSDDEDLLQRELERKCWKAGRLVCCRLAGREEGRHVVFVLRAVGNYSIVACYHGLSHRLGLILKHG